MSGEQERIDVGIDENRRGKTVVRWHVWQRSATVGQWQRGTVIADLEAPRDEASPRTVREAIAAHYGVQVNAVEYTPDKGASAKVRLVPSQAWVTLPPVKPTCQHTPGEPACQLPDCYGTPPVDTPMDRDVRVIGAEPNGGFETGDVICGREITKAVEAATGFAIADATVQVANNGWSDTRPGVRKVHGLLFTVVDNFGTDGFDVRVLSYEAKAGWFAAVYVDGQCVAPAIDQDRGARTWRITAMQEIVEAVEAAHDVREIADPANVGHFLRLKNPAVGFRVHTTVHGVVTVAEPSSNRGMTLRVVDSDGTPRFIDRKQGAGWIAEPPPQDDAPAGRVHVRSSSPTTVDFTDGRQGLANPTWCGRINGEKAWHVYGLKAETVTCPVCFHLFTCPWAQLDDRVNHCSVCAHIYGCTDQAHADADHPGEVPAPDPDVDRATRAGVLVERAQKAVLNGFLDFADRLIDAGENYEPALTVPYYGSWGGLREHVRQLRETRQEDGAHDVQAPAPEPDEVGALWADALA
jgi:hypothetical protein